MNSLLSLSLSLITHYGGIGMPPKTQNRKTDVVRDFRRVVVKVPLSIAHLMDLVANYRPCTKGDLAEDIWRAGLVAHFGLDQEDLEEVNARPLPRGTQPPKDTHELVDALLRDA